MLVARLEMSPGDRCEITFDAGQFRLVDEEISAQDIVSHDAQGRVEWAYSGLRAWVLHLAAAQRGEFANPPDAAGANHDAGRGTREIRLTQGKVTLVDEADYPELSRWKWHAQKWHSQGVTKFSANRIDPVAKKTMACTASSWASPRDLRSITSMATVSTIGEPI